MLKKIVLFILLIGIAWWTFWPDPYVNIRLQIEEENYSKAQDKIETLFKYKNIYKVFYLWDEYEAQELKRHLYKRSSLSNSLILREKRLGDLKEKYKKAENLIKEGYFPHAYYLLRDLKSKFNWFNYVDKELIKDAQELNYKLSDNFFLPKFTNNEALLQLMKKCISQYAKSISTLSFEGINDSNEFIEIEKETMCNEMAKALSKDYGEVFGFYGGDGPDRYPYYIWFNETQIGMLSCNHGDVTKQTATGLEIINRNNHLEYYLGGVFFIGPTIQWNRRLWG